MPVEIWHKITRSVLTKLITGNEYYQIVHIKKLHKLSDFKGIASDDYTAIHRIQNC